MFCQHIYINGFRHCCLMIPWISSYIHYQELDTITYPCPNCNGAVGNETNQETNTILLVGAYMLIEREEWVMIEIRSVVQYGPVVNIPQNTHNIKHPIDHTLGRAWGVVCKFKSMFYNQSYWCRGHFAYGFNRWETTLPCNVVSHWLRPYPEWSICNIGW